MSGYLIDMKPTVGQQIAELERELKVRRQVFPKWVAARKMSQKAADWQIACIEETISLLKAMQQKPPAPFLFGRRVGCPDEECVAYAANATVEQWNRRAGEAEKLLVVSQFDPSGWGNDVNGDLMPKRRSSLLMVVGTSGSLCCVPTSVTQRFPSGEMICVTEYGRPSGPFPTPCLIVQPCDSAHAQYDAKLG